MSWRKLLMAVAVLAVVGASFAPTEASARWRGRFWAGSAIGLGLGLGLGAGYPYYRPYYAPPPYYYGGYGYYGCWRRVVVYGPWGPRVRRVWVCG